MFVKKILYGIIYLVEDNSLEILTDKQKLKPMNISMLVTHALNNVISLFVSTFLISYIYSISSNYVQDIGLFYCFNYIAMTLFYIIISKMIDRTNRVIFYRLAIIIRGIFIIGVVFAGKQLASYVILAGFLHGTSEAFYWTSYNLMKNELVSKHAIGKYALFQQVDERLVNILVPLILGKLIDAESFILASYLILAIVVVQMIFTFFIKSKRPAGSSFEMKEFFQETSNLGERKKLIFWIIVLGGVYGLTNVVAPLNTMLIMLSFGSNFSLGIITSVFAVGYVILLFIFKRFTSVGHRNFYYITFSILPFFATIILMFNMNKTLLVIYMAIYTLASSLYGYGYDVVRNILLKKLNMYNSIAEYQCAIEVVMGVIRTLIFGVLALTGIICQNVGIEGFRRLVEIETAISILTLSMLNFGMILCEKKFLKEGIIED